MLKNVIEDYIRSIKEIQFFLPFQQLIEEEGYYDRPPRTQPKGGEWASRELLS